MTRPSPASSPRRAPPGGGSRARDGQRRGGLVSVEPGLGDRRGVGFASPTDRIETALGQLMAGEGIEPADFGFKVGKVGAVEVRQIDPTGPAAAAGFQVGDRTLRIGARHIPDLPAFRRASPFAYGGQIAGVQLPRDGRKRTLELPRGRAATEAEDQGFVSRLTPRHRAAIVAAGEARERRIPGVFN